jgi:hypothetical protein
VWFIDFPTKEDVTGERCRPLVPALLEASRHGPLIIVATVPPELRFVEPSMPTFWLEVMTQGGLRVSGIGVVTRSLAVRTVVNAFGLAMKLREQPILSRTFPVVRDAVNWARSVVLPRSVIQAEVVRPPRSTSGR